MKISVVENLMVLTVAEIGILVFLFDLYILQNK